MSRPPKGRQAPETPDPSFERPDDAATRSDALWTIAQQLHEITGGLAENKAKTERLITDVGSLSKQVEVLDRSLAFAKGFAMAAILLIPLCAGLVWWLVGGKLNDIRDQLYQSRRVSASAPPPSSSSPDSTRK